MMLRSGKTEVSLYKGLIKSKNGKKIVYFKVGDKTYEIPSLVCGKINRRKNTNKKSSPPIPKQNTTINKKK